MRWRLLPETPAKGQRRAAQADACRYVWNHCVARDPHWRDYTSGPRPGGSFYGMGTYLTALKRQRPRRQRHHAGITRYTLKYRADAYRHACKGARGGPKFKSRCRDTPACTIPDTVKWEDGGLTGPKSGWMQLKGDNPYAWGQPRQVRIRQEGTADRPTWYAYVVYHVPAHSLQQGAAEGVLGLDRNVRQCVSSDGALYRMTDTARLDAKSKRTQRRRARKRNGSMRHRRVGGPRLTLQRKRKRIGDNDTHRISRRIAAAAHTVAVEERNVSGMTRSATGDVDHPGTNVKQKAGLNREILRSHWSRWAQRLSYTCGEIKYVNPAYTRQTCHKDSDIDKDHRPDQATFYCRSCDIGIHADGNAAWHIVARANLAVARGKGATARREALPSGTLTTRAPDAPAKFGV